MWRTFFTNWQKVPRKFLLKGLKELSINNLDNDPTGHPSYFFDYFIEKRNALIGSICLKHQGAGINGNLKFVSG